MAKGGRTPVISADAMMGAEKLASVRYTKKERDLALRTVGLQVARERNRRKVVLDNALGPACVFEPLLPGTSVPTVEKIRRSSPTRRQLPASDIDIAFAPLTDLSAWLKTRKISSRRLTELYLSRLQEHDGKLEAVVTLTADLAMAQARRADREIARGKWRGPLHGVPWGAKDLLDTRGIATTWGAGPYAGRMPKADARVVTLLEEAGAVLVAKLSLGALAWGELWHKGKTRNPWNLEEGSSGSSAGSGAAVAAGCVGFAIGSETLGSILSPSDRCGTVGLRPTFGRVPRTGAMALCWSLDKLGPLTRGAEDTVLVLEAIDRFDAADPGSRDVPLDFDARRGVEGAVIGYDPAWLEAPIGTEADRDALNALKRAGCRLKKIRLPDLPYDSLETILNVEAAAAFEELTLDNRDDDLPLQGDVSWPNEFRKAHLVSAVDMVQTERLRRRVMQVMAEIMEGVDALLAPVDGTPLLTITNCTGHPALAVPTGMAWRENEDYAPTPRQDGSQGRLLPHDTALWGRLYEDGRLVELGMALERELGRGIARPPLFAAGETS